MARTAVALGRLGMDGRDLQGDPLLLLAHAGLELPGHCPLGLGRLPSRSGPTRRWRCRCTHRMPPGLTGRPELRDVGGERVLAQGSFTAQDAS